VPLSEPEIGVELRMIVRKAHLARGIFRKMFHVEAFCCGNLG
jgi:hypothetical protein